MATWELLDQADESFAARSSPAILPLSENDIAIFGGNLAKGIKSCLFDLLVYDVSKKTCRKIFESYDFKLESFNNQIALVNNKVIALVNDSKSHRYSTVLIEWELI